MRNNLLLVIAVAALAIFASCNKDNLSQQEIQSQNGSFEVTIKGEMGEFAPSTKSTAESCIRMKWSEGDVVWAYDMDGGSLGKLTVTIEESDYIAIMTGTLSGVPSDNKLFLVHSPLMDRATQPTYSSGLSIDMSSQTTANETPFVAYAVVEGVTSTKPSGLKTKFSFATSVLKVNATGIAKGAEFTSASISDIETVCRLTISEGAFYVTGGISGTITKTLSGTASLSRASFYVGVPSFSAGTQRALTVAAGGKNYLEHKVMQTAYAENNYVNYVYEVKTLDYVDEYGINRGEGTYIESTGVVWAPVNCGYEPTNYKYGKLFQWGRKNGCGYQDEDQIQSGNNGTTSLAGEKPNKFYANSNDWCNTHLYNLWDASISAECVESSHIPTKSQRDPCPEGWRVPTYFELSSLLENKSSWTSKDSQNGYWLSGSLAFSESAPQVFLSAAGVRWRSSGFETRGSGGYYWCSSAKDNDYAWIGKLSSGGTEMKTSCRAQGNSVRCVQE